MSRPNDTDKLFPLKEPAMQSLFAELEIAAEQCSVDSHTSNIYGALLIDIASGRGLTTLSRHLCAQFLQEPYFYTEGMERLTELPPAIAIHQLESAFDAELASVRRFGRFRGMMVIDLSAYKRSDEEALERFIEYIAEYRNDIVFVFRTDPKASQQFSSVMQLLSRRFLMRSCSIVERDNRHYYQKALDQLRSIGFPCPLELEETVYQVIDAIAEGASFAGFDTVGVIAQEIAACAQRSGSHTLTAEVLSAYRKSELYAVHASSERNGKMGF